MYWVVQDFVHQQYGVSFREGNPSEMVVIFFVQQF